MGKPKDPYEFPIKWSVVRSEVFKIHPIYRQEYEAAFQDYLNGLSSNLALSCQAELRKSFISSPQASKLAQRWGLNLAFHPDDKVWNNPPESVPLLFTNPGLAVKVIPFGAIKINPPPPENPWDRIDSTPLLKEGRYLRVEIDLFASKGQIQVEIENAVKRFQAKIVRSPRPKDSPRSNLPPIPPELSIDFDWWKPKQAQEDQTSNVAKKSGAAHRWIFI